MKKIMNIFVLVAAAAMALASCQKPEIETPTPQEYEYTFLIGNADTKATIGETCVEWESGDQLGLYSITSSEEVSYNTRGYITPGTPAVMKVYSYYALASGDMIYAYYPYASQSSQVPTSVELSIPTNQTESDAMPMVASPVEIDMTIAEKENTEVPSGTFNLHNLGSVIEFNVYSSDPAYQEEKVKSVTFTADKAIAGSFNMDLTAVDGTDASMEITGLTETEIVSTLSTATTVGTSNTAATKVNMVVAPGSYAGTVVVTTDKATYTYTISEKEFARSAVKPLGVNLAKGERVEQISPETITWDLSTNNTSTLSGEEIGWSSSAVNLLVNKGESGTATNNYVGGVGRTSTRFYSGHQMTITPKNGATITSIVFTATTEGYASALSNSTWTNATTTNNTTEIIVTPTNGTEAISAEIGGTCGFTSITVYYLPDPNYVPPTLESISVSGQTKEFTVGDVFEFGGTVTATYSDESTDDVTDDATFSGYNMTEEGEQTVTVAYEDQTTTYTITVTAASNPGGGDTQYFEKVTSAPSDWSGTYLIVYEDGKVAFDGALTTLDAVSNTVKVTISGSKIEATDAMKAAVFTINASGHIKSASGYYVGQTSNNNGLKSSQSTTYTNTLSVNNDGTVNVVSGGAYLRYNSASNQNRFRYYKSSSYTSQKAICLYKLN